LGYILTALGKMYSSTSPSSEFKFRQRQKKNSNATREKNIILERGKDKKQVDER